MTRLVRFDWAMKYLLRNKANFDILEGFLSELLKLPLKIDNILESESNKNHADDKQNRVDLLVVTDQGERIIIEVQCSSQWDYFSRILYGTSKVLTEHLLAGAPYGDICKVISVSLVFFNLGEGKDYLYKGTTTFRGLHFNDILQLSSNELKMYTKDSVDSPIHSPEAIFPEYYLIKVNQFNERIKDKFDEWIYFLKNGKIDRSFNAQGLQSAAKKLDILMLDDNERRAYESYQAGLRDEASMAAQYHVDREEARAEGREEGREEGKSEALTNVVLNMISLGISFEVISSATGLTIEEIKTMTRSSGSLSILSEVT